jgi:hypothetical protein
MDYVVEHHAKPKSVEDFSQIHNFEEELFYEHFYSFKALEKEIYKVLFENSAAILIQSEEYTSFSTKDKLLSLYYTFFENLALNRAYISIALEGYQNQLKALSILSELKKCFIAFVDSLALDTLNLNIDSVENIQKTAINESAWIQFLITLKFWLDDTSEDFQKTDIFIEKSLNTSFDLLDTKSLSNIIDLGKFLYQEKFHSN